MKPPAPFGISRTGDLVVLDGVTHEWCRNGTGAIAIVKSDDEYFTVIMTCEPGRTGLPTIWGAAREVFRTGTRVRLAGYLLPYSRVVFVRMVEILPRRDRSVAA